MLVSGVLLAAGSSVRFGSPKMLALLSGEPLVRRSARAFTEAALAEVLVVVPPSHGELGIALEGLPVRLVVNPAPEDGMFSSVLAGLRAVDPACAWIAVSPADLPGLGASTVARLVAALAEPEGPSVTVPVADGRRGHPILLSGLLAGRVATWDASRRLSDALRETDVRVREIAGFGPEILRDLDTQADAVEWRAS